MGLTDSPARLAIIFIIAGVVIVFAIFGTSVRSIFVSSTTEEGTVEIKQADECIVQASDGIPRKITNCPYEQGETISITSSKDNQTLRVTVQLRAESYLCN